MTAPDVSPKPGCSLCGSLEPKPGCPQCELRQPSLFSIPPPALPDEPPGDSLAEKAKLDRAARDERLRFYAALERPVSVGLVGCAKVKRNYETSARDLYVGPLFRLGLRYAEQSCDETYILSAFHDLLHLDRIVKPYDRSVADMSKRERGAWADRVSSLLAMRLPRLRLRLVVLAGADYALPLQGAARARSWEVETPLARLSIGARKAWLAERTEENGGTPPRRKRRGGR